MGNFLKQIEKIKQKLLEHLPVLKEEFKVEEIGIFGSHIRGEAHEASDLDLLVSVDLSIDLLKFIELENYLSEVLGVRVDLVMKDSLKPHLGKQILREVVYI